VILPAVGSDAYALAKVTGGRFIKHDIFAIRLFFIQLLTIFQLALWATGI
jgi:hypothetical protein